MKTRSRTVVQVAEQVAVRLDPTRATLDPKGEALIKKLGPAYQANLRHAHAALEAIGPADWTAERILDAVKARAEANGVSLGDALQPIRVALTGGTVSEPVNELLFVVGRETSLATLARAAG